jgi:hypothetical protein
MGIEVAPSRSIIFREDVAYRRSVSEAILTKVAAQNNFINAFQTDIKEFKLNGSYSVVAGIDFIDGVAPFFFNSEIVGIGFANEISGSSGVTEFDVRWLDTNSVDQGSIFSVTPKISSASSNKAVGFQNLVTGTTVSPTGITLATFSKTTFNEGESIYLTLPQTMTEASNASFTIYYRPIN